MRTHTLKDRRRPPTRCSLDAKDEREAPHEDLRQDRRHEERGLVKFALRSIFLRLDVFSKQIVKFLRVSIFPSIGSARKCRRRALNCRRSGSSASAGDAALIQLLRLDRTDFWTRGRFPFSYTVEKEV